MKEILVPVGSPAEALRAVERAIALYRAEPVRVHLLNVQRPLPRHVSRFFPRSELQAFHHDAGMAQLAPAQRVLDAAGVPHDDHVIVGHAAEAIVEFAERHGCDDILIDTPAKGLLSILHAGSIGSQVRHLLRAQTDAAAGSAQALP
jgi:nucleotide-binding universal stress UspA family protein